MIFQCPKCHSREYSITADMHTAQIICLDCGEVYIDSPLTPDLKAAIDASSTQPHFTGEVMKCCMCAKEQRHDPNIKSGWTYLDVGDFAVHVCPGCLQESEQARHGHFDRAYEKVLRRVMRLRERHLSGLNN